MNKYYQNYYLALGSNLGDRAQYLAQARAGLEKFGNISQASQIIETEPIGAADQLFLNQVIVYQTQLTPTELLDSLKALETELGRQPREHWGNREIDLDIILWSEGKLDTITPRGHVLHLPHPELKNRPFLLQLLTHLSP